MNNVICKWYNPKHKIAVLDLKNVYLVKDKPVLLIPEFNKCLQYRIPKTSTKIGKRKIKDGLIKQDFVIKENLPF